MDVLGDRNLHDSLSAQEIKVFPFRTYIDICVASLSLLFQCNCRYCGISGRMLEFARCASTIKLENHQTTSIFLLKDDAPVRYSRINMYVYVADVVALFGLSLRSSGQLFNRHYVK